MHSNIFHAKNSDFFELFSYFFFEFTVAREQMSSGAEMDYRLIYIKYVIHALRYTHNFEKQNSTASSLELGCMMRRENRLFRN